MSLVILVSPDLELRRLVKIAFRDTTVRVVLEAGTAKEAVEGYQAISPDLVILDLFVAGTSGLDLIKSLMKVNEKSRFILLSRTRTRNALEKAFRLGAHDVLVYPVAMDILRDTVLHRLETQLLQEAEDKTETP